MKRVVFDIETNGLLAELDTIHSLVLRDADNPGVVVSCADQSGFVPISEGLQILREAELRVGHNIIDFDEPAIHKAALGSLPRDERQLDTLVCVRLMFPEIAEGDYRRPNFPSKLIGSHSLKAWGYRLGVLKGSFGETSDWSQWTPEMQSYCEQDTLVTVKLLQLIDKMKWDPRSVDLEHRFARLIQRQETNGFGFDENRARELYSELSGQRDEIVAQLQQSFPPRVEEMKSVAYYVDPVTEERYATKSLARGEVKARLVPGPKRKKYIPFNPGSRTEAAARLQAKGWEPDEFTDTGRPKVDDETLARCTLPEAPLLAKFHLIDKRIGQLAEGKEGWLRVCRDGKIHGRVITNGAVTGRCTHRGPNVAQTPRVITVKNEDGDDVLLWGEKGGWATDMRACWRPTREGWFQVGADASGLELRCMAHFLAPFDKGRYCEIVTDGDVHVENRDVFGLTPDKAGRNKAKTGIYCLIYGGGDEKLGLSLGELTPENEAAAQKTEIPKWAMRSMAKAGPVTKERVRNWRRGRYARTRMFKGLFGYAELVKKVEEVLGSRDWLKGLDGRRLKVRKKHAALNTLLQSAGALLVKYGTVLMAERLEEQGYRWGEDWALMAHIHDEIQAEARTEEIAHAVGQAFVWGLKKAAEEFGFKCRLDGEYKIGRNWAETH